MSDVPRATRIELPTPTEELHIIRKLGLYPNFFSGAATPAERGARLAKVIREKHVGRIPVWRNRDDTYDEICLRWYGVQPISTDQPQPETVSP